MTNYSLVKCCKKAMPLLLLSILFYSYSKAQSIIYVKEGGSGNFSGDSWANATPRFQEAIYVASAGDQVWVAAGEYQPALNQSFSMKEGVKIYGSFAGTEANLNDRDLSAGVTSILKGAGKSVFFNLFSSGTPLTPAALLDGFKITGGGANDGSGMYNQYSSPTLSNCIFSGNSADQDGGGIFNANSSPVIINCIFSGNSATRFGGGIFNMNSSSPTIINCTFSGNNATNNGGGMLNFDSSPTITNSIIYGNSSGIYNLDPNSTPAITYSLIQEMPADATNHNLDGDLNPRFVDVVNNNFSLQHHSPAINRGDNNAIPADINIDLAGNTRIYSSAVDLGAYESDNDAPVITAGPTEAIYTENDAPVAIDEAITLTDDSPALASASIQFGSGYLATEDTLAFKNSDPTAFGNIDATFDDATGMLTLTSSSVSATVAQWQNALRAVTYANTSEDPATSNRALKITVTDGSETSAANITVKVVEENDAPVIISDGGGAMAAIAIDENTTAITTVAVTDADGDTPVFSLSGGDDKALFSIDASNGTLTFIAAPNAEAPKDADADNAYVVKVSVSDGTASIAQELTVTVDDVNDVIPVITSGQSFALNENSALGTVVGTLAATDGDNTVTTFQDWTITGGNTGNAFTIDAATGEITVADDVPLDREIRAGFTLEVTVTDGKNTSLAEQVGIMLNNVNENAPVAVSDSYETDEDKPLQILAPGVLENDTDADLNVALFAEEVSQPVSGTLSFNSDGAFTYMPNANFSGTDSFTYRVGDGTHTSNTATVSIAIKSVNDAPVISSLEDVEIAINNATGAIAFTIEDPDNDFTQLEVSASAEDNVLVPTSGIALSGSGASYSLILTPASDETGNTEVTVKVSDGTLEVEETFTLTVYPVNIAPTDIALSNNTFVESIDIGAEVGIFTTIDENADDSHTYGLVAGVGDEHNDLFIIEGDRLITNGAYDYEFSNNLSIRVRTTDQWGEAYEKVFVLKMKADPGLELEIPTAFTPNNDGVNDVWEINNITLHSEVIIKIFNRAGRAVFSSQGYGKAWDGTWNGKTLPFGTYYFIINLNDQDSRTYKGTVMILQ